MTTNLSCIAIFHKYCCFTNMGLLGLRQSESSIDRWIVWELTPINRLRFSDIDLFTDCSPAQPILQTAPVTTQCACSPWTSGRKKHRGPVCYNSMIKIDVFCIKIHLIYYKMAWIMSHHGEKPVRYSGVPNNRGVRNNGIRWYISQNHKQNRPVQQSRITHFKIHSTVKTRITA